MRFVSIAATFLPGGVVVPQKLIAAVSRASCGRGFSSRAAPAWAAIVLEAVRPGRRRGRGSARSLRRPARGSARGCERTSRTVGRRGGDRGVGATLTASSRRGTIRQRPVQPPAAAPEPAPAAPGCPAQGRVPPRVGAARPRSRSPALHRGRRGESARPSPATEASTACATAEASRPRPDVQRCAAPPQRPRPPVPGVVQQTGGEGGQEVRQLGTKWPDRPRRVGRGRMVVISVSRRAPARDGGQLDGPRCRWRGAAESRARQSLPVDDENRTRPLPR